MMAGVDQHQIARSLAAVRLLTGGLLLLAPGVTARLWLGESGDRGVKMVVRAMGARDVALALGALRALDDGEGAESWLAGGAAADATDALASLIGLGRHRPGRALVVGAMAGAAAFAGAKAARELADA
jgi:hypothetical protein